MSERETLLVVEDEPTSRELLSAYLENLGYRVLQAGTAAAARLILKSSKIDLVLLDIGLPDEDGITFARRLNWPEMPLVFVTERGNDADKILALETGSDGYVTKPYNPRELALRLRNIFSRMKMSLGKRQDEVINLRNHRIDLGRHTVRDRQGKTIILTRSEFSLLRKLALENGRTVSREALLNAINPDTQYDVYDRTVDVLISRVRKKLKRAPDDADIILTVPGHGYRLNI